MTTEVATQDAGARIPSRTSLEGLYVYCVARGPDNYPLGSIGLDGGEVYTLASGDLCAVVQNRRAKTCRSEEPDTIEGWVLVHQQVVTAATEAFGTALPMSFNMIVHGDENGAAADNLTAWLDQKRDRFTGLLDKLAGKAEYGVQVFWDPEVITAALVQSDPELRRMRDDARTKPKGLAYMLQQTLAKAARAALEAEASRRVGSFYARIRECVEDIRVDRLKKADPAPTLHTPGPAALVDRRVTLVRERQMLLNLSCLMDQGAAGVLGRVLDEIEKTEGVSVRYTGPWPPYNFVTAG